MSTLRHTPEPIPLQSTFHHNNWEIKYALLSSSPSPKTTSQSSPPQTVVFIHGTPWSSAVFTPLATSLLHTAPNLKILLYDLPGYGQSQNLTTPTPPGPKNFQGSTSVKSQASALAALLSHLSLDGKNGEPAPAVLAHDIAGTIALRAHLLHGCEFEQLMLLDTNVVLPWGDGFYKLAREQYGVFTQLPGHVHEAVVRAVVRSASVRAGGLGEWEEVLVAPWVGSQEAQESFVRQIAQADDGDVAEMFEGEMYGSVRCQVTVLWGDGDSWIPREKMERLCGLLGERLEKPLVVVEGAGHLLMLDQPEKVEDEVRSWLVNV